VSVGDGENGMTSLEEFRAFADKCVPEIARAIRDRNFADYSRHFDPELPDEFTESDFLREIDGEQDGLGYLQSHTYFGHVKGNQNEHPGSVRFVYGGVFTQSEGLIILSVHDREGTLYLNEHVYYWD
jgi:hypothetical protein